MITGGNNEILTVSANNGMKDADFLNMIFSGWEVESFPPLYCRFSNQSSHAPAQSGIVVYDGVAASSLSMIPGGIRGEQND